MSAKRPGGYKWYKPKRPYEEKPCVICSTPFGPTALRTGYLCWREFDKAKCCSRVCAAKSRERAYEEKTCTVCGKLYGPRRSKNGTFCWPGFDRQKKCSPTCRKPKMFGPKRQPSAAKQVDVAGVVLSVRDLMALTGLTKPTIHGRIQRGLDPLTGKRKP